MNFFFSIHNNIFKSEINIPKFRNKEKKFPKYFLYSAEIKNNNWKIKKMKCINDNYFFILKNRNLSNDKIFFLAKENEVLNYNKKQLEDFNNYTNTDPEFRCNLKIYNSKGGFSSYQSEYPFHMTKTNGSLISPIYNLLNKNSNLNSIFIKNIYYKPVNEPFDIFLINISKKKVLLKKTIFTNKTNEINIPNKLINKNVYLFSQKFIGIPVYVNSDGLHISMEHTHPPHLYLWGKNRYLLVKELKNKINEIICKKNI